MDETNPAAPWDGPIIPRWWVLAFGAGAAAATSVLVWALVAVLA